VEGISRGRLSRVCAHGGDIGIRAAVATSHPRRGRIAIEGAKEWVEEVLDPNHGTAGCVPPDMDDVPAEGYQLVGSCRSGSPATIGTTVVVARRNGKAVQLTCHQLALSCTTSQRPAAHLGVVSRRSANSNTAMAVAASCHSDMADGRQSLMLSIITCARLLSPAGPCPHYL